MDGGSGSSAVESNVTESRPVRFPTSILWQQSESIRVNANIAIVLVVNKQPLECMKYYNPPDTKVTVRVSCSFFPDHNDVELTGKSRQGVRKAGYILRQVDDMSTICILSMR